MKFFVNKIDLLKAIDKLMSKGKTCYYREAKGTPGWVLFF